MGVQRKMRLYSDVSRSPEGEAYPKTDDAFQQRSRKMAWAMPKALLSRFLMRITSSAVEMETIVQEILVIKRKETSNYHFLQRSLPPRFAKQQFVTGLLSCAVSTNNASHWTFPAMARYGKCRNQRVTKDFTLYGECTENDLASFPHFD
ncbi:hypothetical protein P5673_008987 [Acropora cervicornis]|uniref:Uncharacterized protein n=1 Tax=Acropora cervicornis TaxID=6130 RepID=A0AAD9QTF1_ACRCE|nr:hypothetical protein P5673_008987 [Acropora cervicornis]